jgi:amino acid transporter
VSALGRCPYQSAELIPLSSGWITVFAWQATATSITYLTATQIQGLIILNYDEYEPQRWHGTALMIAVLLSFVCTNIWGMRLLPAIELIGGILHITLFIVIVVALVILAPRSSSEFVFTGFINEGGWQNDGVSWCIGLLTVVYCFVGMALSFTLNGENSC